MAADLISPRDIKGPELDELLQTYWPDMRMTRERAQKQLDVINGEDTFVLPETFKIAGADQYIADIPHPRTVPARVLQGVIADRPHLSVPLGPKGLGLTAQRQTTKVETPLNSMMEDPKAGFKWKEMCAIGLYEGWAAGITVTDPSDWQKHNSAWDDSEAEGLIKQAKEEKTPEKRVALYQSATRATDASKRKHDLSLDVYRARNIPIRHRALSIRNCAPMFGPDMSVEGLIVSQEFSTSWLRRKYDFGDAGLATPTGRNTVDSTGGSGSTRGGTLTLIEAWLYDEDGVPWVCYCVKGKKGAVETRWKGRDGDYATINLQERYGLSRLPVAWEFFLGNPGETNPDKRAMGFTEPLAPGWKSVRSKLTSNNVAILFGSYPILIEEPTGTMALGPGLEDDEPTTPDVMPLKIIQGRPGTKLSQLKIEAVGAEAFRQIELELGMNAEESPGKSNSDQSGFSQSLAAGFEEIALTTVKESLDRLYEADGSFRLEAGKRVPEQGKKQGGTKWPNIMVFKSTDVPVNDSDDKHRDPMEFDSEAIDETFTAVARHTKSMSIPERQQSMEEVARNLKTRRRHLEDVGDENPEETEIELMLESIRAQPKFQEYALKLMAQVQGSEELEQIAQGQQDGLANEAGNPIAGGFGVAPTPPPGVQVPMQQGAPGVPVGGSVTGMGGSSYGQAALGGVVGAGAMTGPINQSLAAGGVLPSNLPAPAAAPVGV